MTTDKQKQMAADLCRIEAIRLRREASSLDNFVVEETPKTTIDYIAELRSKADEYSEAADAFEAEIIERGSRT